jgi:hypothetical protein
MAHPTRIFPRQPALFTLGQPWAAEPDLRLQPTLVEAYFREGQLRVLATLWDADIANAATEHNQRTWELGDVFEIFVRREDSAAYSEIHVTPGNIRLHLRFQDALHHQRIASIAEVAADPDAIFSAVKRFDGGWKVEARVPMDAGVGDKIRVSFCRYDAAPHWPSPILSTSSPHPVVKFHRPEEWLPLEICGD